MTTVYPAGIDSSTTLPTVVDGVTSVKAEVINTLRDTEIAIEAELGIKPSGTYNTVRARLDALQNGTPGPPGPPGPSSGMNFKENGVALTNNPYDHLNVIGAGGTVSDVGGEATLNLSSAVVLPPQGLTLSLQANNGPVVSGGNGIQTTIAAGSNTQSLPQSTIYLTSTTGLAASGTIYILLSAGGGAYTDSVQTITYGAISGSTLTGCYGGSGVMTTGDLVTDCTVQTWYNQGRSGNYLTGGGALALPNSTGINGLPSIDFTFNTGAGFSVGSSVFPINLDYFIAPNGFTFASIFQFTYGVTSPTQALFGTTIAAASAGQALSSTPSTIFVISTSGFAASGHILITIGQTQQRVAYSSVTGGGSPSFNGCTGGTGTLATGQDVSQISNPDWIQQIVGPNQSYYGPGFGLAVDPNDSTKCRVICWISPTGVVDNGVTNYFVISPRLAISSPHYAIATFGSLNSFSETGTFTLYIDSLPAITSGPYANPALANITDNPLQIGLSAQSTGSKLGAHISEIDVWAQALSTAQVTAAQAWLKQQGGF